MAGSVCTDPVRCSWFEVTDTRHSGLVSEPELFARGADWVQSAGRLRLALTVATWPEALMARVLAPSAATQNWELGAALPS